MSRANISYETKRDIIIYKSKDLKFQQIVRQLKSQTISVTRQTVSNEWKKYQCNGTIACAQQSTERRCKITSEIKNFIDAAYSKNDELTSVDLVRAIFQAFDLIVSTSTIKVVRRKLGWVKSGIKYCQQVRAANQIQRMIFAQRCLALKENFDDVIFTDESSVWLDRHARICFRRKNEPPKPKPKVKHPFKLHVWAGISRRGRTKMIIFSGIMRKEFYVKILDDSLLEFIEKRYPDSHRFQQDNDPKHKSKFALKYLEESNINYWPTPAESPDLNPIEMLWAEMKHYLRKYVKPSNKEQLVTGLQNFWNTVTVEKCNRYIDHLYKVLPT